MFNKTRLNTCLALAFGSCLVAGAAGVQAQTTERIVITGSNIKRVQAEGPLPIAVITRAEIDRAGVATTNDLLRSLSYMSSFNDELLSNSPNGTGTAAAGFRGLGGDQTVVLLNGRRLANYGFDGAFVNLNTIPLGAIQRVEVLKDGAAAIYGADAIGGVINFITRKDFTGFEISAGAGTTSRSDLNEVSGSLTAGFGDLDKSGFNVLLNLNYFKRDPLNNLDRERTRTADFRRFGGGNQMSTFAPTGNVVNPVTGKWQPLTPCGDPTLVVTPSPLSPGDAGSSSCLWDFSPYRTTLFGTERIGGFASGRVKLGANASLFAEAMYADSDQVANAAPTPGNFTLPVGHPANPFNVEVGGANLRGRPIQPGPRTTNNVAEASRYVAGVEALVGGWDVNVALGRAENKAQNKDSGYFLIDKMQAAIANRTFNPFATNNPQSVIDSISSKDSRIGETTYSFFDAKASGEIFKLAGGAASLAVGLTVGNEEIADVPGINSQTGNVFGSIRQSVVRADRGFKAAYLEMAAPFTKSLEAQFAVRHDSYEGGTKSTTPKIALRWQPTSQLLLRGSYSEGFKMPSLRDLFGGQNESADSVQDFPGCAARGVSAANCPRLQYTRFSGGNTQLKPEQAKSFNFGMVFEPSANVNFGIDYFIIDKSDEIGLVLTQFVIDNVPYAAGATTLLGGNPAFSVTRNAGGTITQVSTSLGNLGARKIRGLDLNTQVRVPTKIGRLAFEVNGTIYDRYDYADQPGTPLYDRLKLLNLPRWKTTTRAALNTGAWDFSVTGNFRAKFYDKPQSTAATPVTATTALVGNFDTWDMAVSYTGIKGLRLNAGVRNLTDKEPPFSNNDPRTLGFAQVDDIRGRYFWVNANYAF